jgi:diguanylate cyclase (GGDEF)-like protein
MYLVYMTIFTFPLAWLSFVDEINDRTPPRKWLNVLPFALINTAAWLLIILPILPMHPLASYHSCETYWIMNLCMIDYSPVFWGLIALPMAEILYGLIKVLVILLRVQAREYRRRFLLVSISVALFTVSLFLTAYLFRNIPGVDPMPVSFALFGILLFIAIYFQRMLQILPGRKTEVTLLDDLLIAVDRDHYIIDINMATLQAFDLDVKSVIDVQLEHAFVDFPDLLALFDERSGKHILLHDVNGVEHQFDSSLVPIRDTYTNEVVGHRLQLRDVTERASYTTEVVLQAVRDPLTNLYTKESFLEFGGKLCQHNARLRQSLVLALVDIDDFKLVNRNYTHLVGDQALVQLVEIINNIIRSSDMFARWESDELVLLLPKADEFMAYQICSRIKEAVASHHFVFNKQEFQMTVSMGYTVMDAGSECNLQRLVDVANTALLQSRALGRNRLTFLPTTSSAEED